MAKTIATMIQLVHADINLLSEYLQDRYCTVLWLIGLSSLFETQRTDCYKIFHSLQKSAVVDCFTGHNNKYSTCTCHRAVLEYLLKMLSILGNGNKKFVDRKILLIDGYVLLVKVPFAVTSSQYLQTVEKLIWSTQKQRFTPIVSVSVIDGRKGGDRQFFKRSCLCESLKNGKIYCAHTMYRNLEDYWLAYMRKKFSKFISSPMGEVFYTFSFSVFLG